MDNGNEEEDEEISDEQLFESKEAKNLMKGNINFIYV
jgi:hypothetical protein